MPFLTDADRSRIAAAIAAAETRTGGEIVAVIAQAAGDYRAPAVLWPALLALAMPAVALTTWPHLAGWPLYLAQVGLFVVLGLLAHVPAVRTRLVPEASRRRRAARLARQQFFEQGLHLTRDRTGVLIFVAVAEHHVEIIADLGIDRAVPPGSWAKAVAAFVERVRAGQVAEGFLAAISEVGEHLTRHVPRRPDDVDERPNRLIEI
jgi:putative membrane protein